MNAIARALRRHLSREPLDAWLSLWGGVLGGVGVSGTAIAALRQHAASRVEFLLGAMATLVACLLLFLLGTLARLVHLAVRDGQAPWRLRRRELAAHGAGLIVAGLGGWALADAAPDMAGAVTGALLVLGAYTAILCLGCWSTLANSANLRIDVDWIPPTGKPQEREPRHAHLASPVRGSYLAGLLLGIIFASTATGDEPVPKVRTLEGHTSSVMAVVFSPDGKVLVSCSRDKSIRFWDARTGKLERTLTEHTGDVYAVVFARKATCWQAAAGTRPSSCGTRARAKPFEHLRDTTTLCDRLHSRPTSRLWPARVSIRQYASGT